MHDSEIQKEMAVGFSLSAALLDCICVCSGVGLCSQKGLKRAKN